MLMGREPSVLVGRRLATGGPILGADGITVNQRPKGPEIADPRVCALSDVSFSGESTVIDRMKGTNNKVSVISINENIGNLHNVYSTFLVKKRLVKIFSDNFFF